jgi:hypothetical protein
MDVNVNKIKQTCSALGFPQEYLNCLYIEKFEIKKKYTEDDVITNEGFKLGSIHFGRSSDTDNNFIIFSFHEPQDFIEKHILTKYNQKNEPTYGSVCCLEFDDDFNLLTFEVSDCYSAYNEFHKAHFNLNIFLTYNHQLVLTKIRTISSMNTKKNHSTKLFDSEKLVSLPTTDELLLLNFLRYSYTQSVIDIVPEFYIPSAYDFNSEDFKRRMVLVEMLEF